MKYVLASFDPQATTSGTFSNRTPTGYGIMIVRNESPVNLLFTINNDQIRVSAWTVDRIDFTEQTQTIAWQQEEILTNAASAPISKVKIDLFTPDEKVSHTYPIALTRTANVGNTVSTSSSNSLINDGSTQNTQIIETTPSGQTQSALVVDNMGNLTLRTLDNNVWAIVMQIAQNAAGAATKVFHGTADAANAVPATGVTSGALPAGVTIGGGQVTSAVANATNAASVPATGVTAGTFPSGVLIPGSQVSGSVTQATNLSGILNVDNAGSLGTAQILRIKTNATGTNTYDLYISTFNLGTQNDFLLMDHTGKVYANSVAASAITAGAIGSGVTLPASQLTSGAIPAGVTLPAAQLTSGTLPAGVVLYETYNVHDYSATGNGTTDDTTAIANAITACQNGGGGVVYFPPGTYLISSPLNVTVDNVQLFGAGWGSVIKASASFVGANMLYVQSGGTFRYGIRLQDLFFDCNSVSGLTALYLESTYHAVVEHMRVKNCAAVGIAMQGTAGKFGAYNKVKQCTVTDGVGASAIGLKTTNSEWLEIEGCSFVTYSTAGQYGVNLNNLNCTVKGSQFDNCDTALYLSFSNRASVIGCQFDRGGTRFINLRGNQGSTISGCVFNSRSGTGTECIYVNDGNNQGNTITGCSVEPGTTWTYVINESSNTGGPGNVYTGNATGGLKIGNLKTGRANNNATFNPLAELAAPAAPALATAASGGTIAAGTYPCELTLVNAYGETTVSAAANVTTTGASSTITITAPQQTGNAYGWNAYISSDGGATYHLQNVTPQQFLNNLTLTSLSTSAAAPPGANTTKGFSNPSVPASGTAKVNTFGVDCIVYVSGGTVSAIQVGNTTTGLTSGAFRVAAYEAITLTYTVAPSWQWRGE